MAPYFSQPQLHYLYKEKLVHALVGDFLCLMFGEKDYGLTQIIIDIDIDEERFFYVDRQEFLDCFPGCTHVQWMSMCFIFGGFYGLKMSEEYPRVETFDEPHKVLKRAVKHPYF